MKKLFTTSLFVFIFYFINFFNAYSQQELVPSYLELNQVKSPLAILVLFDGAPGYAKDISKETSLPEACQKQKIQCIGIDQTNLFLSDSVYTRLRSTISYCLQKYKIPPSMLFLGGFSLGGYSAVRFAEMAVEKGDSIYIPKAIFGIDPLLDHQNCYAYCEREIARVCSNEGTHKYGKPEAYWLKDYYLKEFGDPEKNASVYIERSCYSQGPDGGNARYLKSIPIMLYYELDLMWYIKERCRDIEDLNSTSGSRLVNYLYNNGNKNAVISVSTDKGKRADGRRHPHSWSIADPVETVAWLKKFIK